MLRVSVVASCIIGFWLALLLLHLEGQLLQEATTACASKLLPQVADVFLLLADAEVLGGFSQLLLKGLSVND